jgi:hypothetical protein
MKRVIIESPFAGETRRNLAYARRCMHHSLHLGEAPFLSHLLYTQCLDDNSAEQRGMGITAGYVWGMFAEAIVFYLDYGEAQGMAAARLRYKNLGIPIEDRYIGRNVLAQDRDDNVKAGR